MKQKLNKKELIEQLKIQLSKIVDFASLFDSGNENYAQEISVKLRVIFHHKGNSKSLLKQLRLEHIQFLDTAKKYESTNVFSHWGLIQVELQSTRDNNSISKYVAPLDGAAENRYVDFENWWASKKIIVDKDKNVFTRRKLILELAETDGGAHVDEGLKYDYHKLSRQNALGWFHVDKWGKSKALDNPVPASIRQIAYETIETFRNIDLDKESKLG